MSLCGKGPKESEKKEGQEKPSEPVDADEAQLEAWEGEAAKEGPDKAQEEPAKALNDKIKDLTDQILRLQAEFSNFRKRTEKEKSEAIRFGREAILEKLIGLTDVLENAL